MQALASIFTGKGGTIRMIVAGLVFLGVLDLAAEYNYEMDGTYKKDSAFSFKPAGVRTETEETVATNVAQESESSAVAEPVATEA